MSLTIIPAVAFLVVMLLPNEKEPVRDYSKKPVQKQTSITAKSSSSPQNTKAALSKVDKGVEDRDSDFSAIFTYIQSKYKSIQKEDAEQISNYLVEYGDKHKIDPKFAAAVIARESSFNKEAVSKTGAKGLGQIKDFNFKSLEINDPFNIKENVKGTTKYLKEMLSRWEAKQAIEQDGKAKDISQDEKVRLALASYYKGYSAVKKDEGKLDQKTNGYVKDILKYYEELISYKGEDDKSSKK